MTLYSEIREAATRGKYMPHFTRSEYLYQEEIALMIDLKGHF